MKDIRASKTLNTIYNNVSNVDTVMVEPKGNGISIFFQADNAENATVTFDALSAPAPIAPIATAKSLKLNNPIESYAPIYKEELQPQKTSSLYNRLTSSAKVASIKDSIDEELVSDGVNKVVSFGLVGLLVFAVARLFRRKDSNVKIGLSQSLNEREINMYKGVQPLQNSHITTEKPYTTTTVNYGLNAYQRENRNPYESTPTHFHNPKLREYLNNAYAQQVAPQPMPVAQPVRPQTMATVQPQVQAKKMTTPVSSAPVNQSSANIDNLKFLESMTAIYEKSGRHDLARGLKASLSKNNIK